MREFCDAPPIPPVYTNLITVMASKIISSLHCQVTKVVQWHEPPWTVTTVRVSYRILPNSHITPTRESSLKSLCHNTSNIRSIELVIACRSTFIFFARFLTVKWKGKRFVNGAKKRKLSFKGMKWWYINTKIDCTKIISMPINQGH